MKGEALHGEVVGGTVDLVLHSLLFAPEEMNEDPKAHT